MIYKAVPGPKIVSIDKNGGFQSATNLFADLINAQSRDGWKYHSMETITTSETTGCLFNKKVIETNIYMLIFYKEN